MDLAVQVGIIFVGALGIAALLPRGDEMSPEDDFPPERVVACPLPPPAGGESAGVEREETP
jgi:hypothetical protein